MCAPSSSCCSAWPKPHQCTLSLSGAHNLHESLGLLLDLSCFFKERLHNYCSIWAFWLLLRLHCLKLKIEATSACGEVSAEAWLGWTIIICENCKAVYCCVFDWHCIIVPLYNVSQDNYTILYSDKCPSAGYAIPAIQAAAQHAIRCLQTSHRKSQFK